MHEHFDQHLNIQKLLRDQQPQLQYVLEIGAGSGENTHLLAREAERMGFHLTTISDGVCPDFLKGYSSSDHLQWIPGISWVELPKLQSCLFDFAIVDSDHNSWTVIQEINELRFLVRSGGIITFHDMVSFASTNGDLSGSGYNPNTGHGIDYPSEQIQASRIGYGDAVCKEMGDGWELVKVSLESCGAAAYRKL